MQKEQNDIDLGLFFELAEEYKVICNQVPINTLLEDMDKLKNGFSTNECFTLGDEGEMETISFFKDSNELANFMTKYLFNMTTILLYIIQAIFVGFFNNFKRVNRSEHGRGAYEFNNILVCEGGNCYIPSGNGCFLKCINYIFKEDLTKEYFKFIQTYKRRNVMTRCRIPDFCERYKIDIGMYDVKSKRILTRTVKERNVCL